MSIDYEWDVETLSTDGYEDILEHDHTENLKEYIGLFPLPNNQRLVLIRDQGNEDQGLLDRQWAYVKDGKLPIEFDGGSKVPKRFHKELEKSTGA